MSDTTPITVTVYPLLSYDGFHDTVPDDLFDVLKTMDSDPNTTIEIKPIAPHMLRPMYTLVHILQVKYTNLISNEPVATATNIGTAYYTVANNYTNGEEFNFLSSILDYGTQPTQTQLHKELSRCVEDADNETDTTTEAQIEELYSEAVADKTYNNRIGLNTQNYFEQYKKSSQTETYIWINNQPLDMSNTESLRKAAMSQFFAKSVADEYEWLEDEDATETDNSGSTTDSQPNETK